MKKSRIGKDTSVDNTSHSSTNSPHVTTRKNLVLLDLDDTLLDNTAADIYSFEVILKRHKIKLPPSDTIIQWRKRGMLSDNIFKRIVKEPRLARKCILERREWLRCAMLPTDMIITRPDAIPFLSHMHVNHVLMIITARHNRPIIMKILRQTSILKYTSGLLCADDCPDLHDLAQIKEFLYSMALNKFDIKKNNVVAIGNLKTDIIPAKKLGIRNYGVRGTYRFDTGLKGITTCFDNLNDITTMF